MDARTQHDMWCEVMRLKALPPERVGQIMAQIGRRVATVERLKQLGAAPVIPDDA